MTPDDNRDSDYFWRTLKRAHDKVKMAEEIVYDALHLAVHFRPSPGRGGAALQPTRDPGKNRAQREREEKAREAYARSGAKELKLVPLSHGRYEALIDGKRFELPPRQGRLLELLAMDDACSADGMVRWKSRRELMERLADGNGTTITESSLGTIVCRLRTRLESKANLSREFIQMDPKHGYRFALRTRRGGPNNIQFP